MLYVQLNTQDGFSRVVSDSEIVWDDTHQCRPSALTTEEATQFKVFPLTETPQPQFDASTQNCVQDGYEKVGDEWRDKWVVTAKPQEQIALELAQAKVSKNQQINDWRAAANQTYFTHAGKQIACDALSRSDIDAVAGSIALTGVFPAGFPGAWKATDNSYIVLPDTDAFKAMYGSMTLQGTLNFGHSQDLKASLAAATTVEQVNSIVWS